MIQISTDLERILTIVEKNTQTIVECDADAIKGEAILTIIGYIGDKYDYLDVGIPITGIPVTL